MRLPFHILTLQFHFLARAPIFFPGGKSANILRGAFGMALARIAPASEYARIFAPRAVSGASGLADPPRPFVLRARPLEGRSVAPGERFDFGVNLFATDDVTRELVVRAFAEASAEGFGPGRGSAELSSSAADLVTLDLAPDETPVARVRVDFVAPTELKHADQVAGCPEFAILFARARDRVAALRSLYGAGPPALDYAGLGRRALQVRTTRFEWTPLARERRSTRTGQTHPIGGFTGFAEYETDSSLAEFLPILRAAQWTGVGRQAVWGKGEIVVRS